MGAVAVPAPAGGWARRSLNGRVFVLALIGLPVLEVLALIEVARAIGWLAALVLLLATSLLGTQLLRVEGRLAVERISRAVAQRRPAGDAALDGALRFLGAALLALPGFVTDAAGALLLLAPTRALIRRRMSRRLARRAVSLFERTGRFAPRGPAQRRADVESTAFEDDLDQLER
ncbi:MAG: protein FxsA [Solirubrobacteraceae bacterium]|nr:protein FxsA [Solirubrobacteraceae bacterium]